VQYEHPIEKVQAAFLPSSISAAATLISVGEADQRRGSMPAPVTTNGPAGVPCRALLWRWHWHSRSKGYIALYHGGSIWLAAIYFRARAHAGPKKAARRFDVRTLEVPTTPW
jgi:hypothetical protein